MSEDTDLDLVFAAARAARPQPPDALTARVLADAYAAQPAAPIARRAAPPPRGVWGRLSEILGGGGVLAGLGTAAVAGVWLGYADPAGMDWLTGALLPTLSGDVQLMQADDLFLGEG
jgi:ferric-dicitrate binding protein FerR (iron transport regulator)